MVLANVIQKTTSNGVPLLVALSELYFVIIIVSLFHSLPVGSFSQLNTNPSE